MTKSQQRTLTAKEITDIIFQKPDRITAGVLDRITWLEQQENKLTRTWPQGSDVQLNNEPYDTKLITPVSELLLTFEFDNLAKGNLDDQRSLRNAMKEMKAIGLKHRQIYFIARVARYNTMLQVVKEHYLEGSVTDKITKHFNWQSDKLAPSSDDHAFLGTQILEVIDPQDGSLENDSFAHLDHFYPKASTIFPEVEDDIYPILLEEIENLIQDKPQVAEVSSWKIKRIPQSHSKAPKP